MTFEIVPTELVIKRVNTVHGIELINFDKAIVPLEVIADDVIEDWSEDYHADDGGDFGSSDMTFLIKNVIDNYIIHNDLNLKTEFLPHLTIISG